MSAFLSHAVDFSLSRLLGGSGEELPRERYQEPTLQQTKRGVWFIRPWVDVIDKKTGKPVRRLKTISIGAMGKREAQSKSREIMQTINRADYVITSQINIGRFVEEYRELHVKKLSASTQAKYENHLKNHIIPAWGAMIFCDLTPLLVQKWLDAKAEVLSWATCTDLRNLLSSIFTKAIEWGRWKDKNPIEYVHMGRKHAAREQRKLSDEDTRRLLAALPGDVRLMCCVCLFGTLRISEALGLQEKHLDFKRGLILVRQRFYRGDLDTVKSDRSHRDVPMGYLSNDLATICKGDPEHFVFEIATNPGGRRESTSRDDRDINQHFLRKAAKALGLYWQGFGFHALRREAVTSLGALLSIGLTMRIAGHSSVDMSAHYTLADQQAQDIAVRTRQEQIVGKTGEKVN